MSELLTILLVLFFISPIFIRKVPHNTIFIIDRNGHYLKTKRSGYYILGPNDRITSMISTKPLSRTLSNYFETDDGKIVNATITCKYHADNLDDVTHSLANVRRSVDDIIQSAAYFAIGNYKFSDITGIRNHEFSDHVSDNLSSELSSIGISLSNMQIYVMTNSYVGMPCFRPQQSKCFSGTSAPHNHDKSLMIGDKYTSGPIIYK